MRERERERESPFQVLFCFSQEASEIINKQLFPLMQSTLHGRNCEFVSFNPLGHITGRPVVVLNKRGS